MLKAELFEVVAVFYFIFSRHRRETVRFSRIFKKSIFQKRNRHYWIEEERLFILNCFASVSCPRLPNPHLSLFLCSIFVGTYYQCSFIESGTQSITSSSPTSKVVPKSRFLLFQRASTFVDSSTASCLFPIFLRLFFFVYNFKSWPRVLIRSGFFGEPRTPGWQERCHYGRSLR